MFNLGMGEIVVVLVLALIVLGPKKLPELASGLGKMIREIRKATAGVKDELHIDDAIRKPFQELRDAVAMPADELRRIDREQRDLEEARRKAAEGAGASPYGAEENAPPSAGEGPSTVTVSEQDGPFAPVPAPDAPAQPPAATPADAAPGPRLPPPPPAAKPVPPPMPRTR